MIAAKMIRKCVLLMPISPIKKIGLKTKRSLTLAGAQTIPSIISQDSDDIIIQSNPNLYLFLKA